MITGVHEFEIPGDPQGKARPRLGKGGNTYTPQKTKDYETLVAWSYKTQCKELFFGRGVPIFVDITAFYPIPKSAPKKKRAAMLGGEMRPMVKPDLDNVAKIICDALNGVAYDDDMQIVTSSQMKFYSDDPRVVVRIGEVAWI